MIRRNLVLLISLLVLTSMVLSACTVAAPAAPAPAPAAEGGEASWWQTAAQADRAALDGIWSLNAEASDGLGRTGQDDPDGPPEPGRVAGRGAGRGGRAGP